MLTTILTLALAIVPPDWYTFEPEGKGFRVELPARPESTSERTVNRANGPVRVTAARSRAAGATYSVQVTENPGRVDPKTLDEGVHRLAGVRKATLGAVRPIAVGGHPGREFEIDERLAEGPRHSKLRLVVSGHSLYMLTVAADPGAALPADADRFLGSLQIQNARAPAAAAAPAEVKPEAEGEAEVVAEAEADDAEEKPKADDAEEKPASPKKSSGRFRFSLSRLPRNARPYPADDLADLARSFPETDRDGFRDVGPAGSVLVGVRASFIERFGGPKVRSLQPIYRLGKNYYAGRTYGQVVPPVMTVVARPGYAVGGLVTHTGLTLDGFGIVFMKVDGDQLDPGDTYKSPWIGDKQGGGPGEVMSPGALAVGLQGRSGTEVNAVGLTILKK